MIPGRLLGAARAAASAAALAALLAGSPYLLDRTLGWTLPSRLPEFAELVSQLQSPARLVTLLQVLACSGWVLWAALLLRTVAELGWYVRHLPQLVHTGDLGPVLLRRGVVGLLVGTLVIGLVAAIRASGPPVPSTDSPLAVAPVALSLPAATSAAGDRDEVTVRRGDTLWGLASSDLGDPQRWPELYRANRDQLQSDGGRLTDPDLIYPGWQLRLPRSSRTGTTAPPVSAPPTPAPSPRPAPPAAPIPKLPDPGASPGAPARLPLHGTTQHGIRLPGGLGLIDVGTATALALLAVAAAKRRRSNSKLRVDDGASEQLTAALRRIVREQNSDDAPFQPNRAAVLGRRYGRSWSLAEALDSGPQPLLLAGPGAEGALRALVTSQSTATAPTERLLLLSSDAKHLGLRSAQAGDAAGRHLGDRPVRVAADAADASAALTEHRLRHAHDGERCPRMVLLGRSDDASVAELLEDLMQAAPAAFGAVLLAEAGAPHSHVVRPDGMVEGIPGAALFRLSREAQTSLSKFLAHSPGLEPGEEELPEDAGSGMHSGPAMDVPALTSSPPAEADEDADAFSPGIGFGDELEGTSPRVPLTPPPAASGRPIRVTLLGGLAVSVHGHPVERAVVGMSGELLALLAVRPEGLTRQTVVDTLWPTHAEAQARNAFNNTKAALRNAVRTALGAGSAQVVTATPGGRWRLDPLLFESDLSDLRSALRDSADRDPSVRDSARGRALDLMGPQLCAGMEWEWLDQPREELRRRILQLLTALATEATTPEDQAGLLARAAEYDPHNEQLHLKLARLEVALGRPEQGARCFEQLQQNLAAIGAKVAPEISSAFRQLLHPATKPHGLLAASAGASSRPARR